MPARRLGLFGGTFDPPHLGHVAVLRAAAASGRFDHLLVTVAGDPYLKSGDGRVHDSATRLAMARVAFEGLDLVEVSDLEVRRPGPSYTIDTVRELMPQWDTIDLIIGADLAAGLPSWERAEDLSELVTVAVVPRPGSATVLPSGYRAYVLDMSPVDLSSTFIREYPGDPDELESLLPAGVIPLFAGSRG